jgi:thymidylate synthase (FAD)
MAREISRRKMMKIEVLDHGFVRLVSYMQPVPERLMLGVSIPTRPPDWTGDLEIIRNARVSHDADWREDNEVIHDSFCPSLLPPMLNGEIRPCGNGCRPRTVSDSKLMDYLYRNTHSTPFEAMVFTFEVKAPIFVFRQWHRHRTWSYNEVSARYTELPSECYIPKMEDIGHQDPKNKQGRTRDTLAEVFAEDDRKWRMVDGYRIEAETAHKTYQDRLGSNVPRELARINLPLSTYSRMFATVNLWNLFRFLHLRDHSHAQYEIQVYAKALKELVRPIVPKAMAAFDRYQLRMIDSEFNSAD